MFEQEKKQTEKGTKDCERKRGGRGKRKRKRSGETFLNFQRLKPFERKKLLFKRLT